jgi:hypothetical protein
MIKGPTTSGPLLFLLKRVPTLNDANQEKNDCNYKKYVDVIADGVHSHYAQ